MVRLPHLKSGRWKAGFLGAVVTCLAVGIILIGAAGNTGSVSQTGIVKTQTTGSASSNPAEVNLPINANDADGQSANTGSVDTNNSAQGRSGSTTSSQPSVANQSDSTASTVPATTSNQVTATLLVNSAALGTVTLAAGSTQCDLLSQALAEGVINQLTMKYSSQYKNYAVYKINNQGDESSVWWVYEVNGKSPPYGCGSVPVNDNDSVNWKYLRS